MKRIKRTVSKTVSYVKWFLAIIVLVCVFTYGDSATNAIESIITNSASILSSGLTILSDKVDNRKIGSNREASASQFSPTFSNHSHPESFNLLNAPTQSVGVGSLDSGVLDTIATELQDVANESDLSNNVVTYEEPDLEVVETEFNIPAYSGDAFVYVNNNCPYFTESEKMSTTAFETYAELDSLGRCGVAYANLCTELLPTEERGDISSVYPSGWVQEKYEGIVDQNWLYNRCHLIAHSLAGENANERNLITGTRYMNIEGMWQMEETVLYYLKDNPSNHVLYRVTPVFAGNNLVANGVLMEAYSVEDDGAGVCFNVYCYNVQPGIVIDYATGESWAEE